MHTKLHIQATICTGNVFCICRNFHLFWIVHIRPLQPFHYFTEGVNMLPETQPSLFSPPCSMASQTYCREIHPTLETCSVIMNIIDDILSTSVSSSWVQTFRGQFLSSNATKILHGSIKCGFYLCFAVSYLVFFRSLS